LFLLVPFALGVFLASRGCLLGYRLPRGENVVWVPSKCDGCGRRLSLLELLPVIGYLLARGKCRECGFRVPVKYPLAEIFLGVVFAALWLRLGPSGTFFRAAVALTLLSAAAFSDLEKREIPDALSVSLLLFGFLFWGVSGRWMVPVLGALACGGLPLVLALIYPGKIGGGDAKLALGSGATLGLFAGALALGAASLVGAAWALCLRQKEVSFAPFLFGGAVLAVLLTLN
jgi:leader peptidase (prepilin peptidase)/N-methyltransferase